MVNIFEGTISLIDAFGQPELFDVSALEEKLMRSFVALGREDIFLAGDIALAVEYALENSPRESKIFTEGELNRAVIKILEDAGFPDVASAYRRDNGVLEVSFSIDETVIAPIIEEQLQLHGDILGHMAAMVASSLRRLNLESASSQLIVELARAYMINDPPSLKYPVEKEGKAAKNIVDVEMVVKRIWPTARKLMGQQVIAIRSISRIFPTVHLELSLNALAEKLDLSLPVTEMSMIPHLYQVGQALNECCEEMLELYKEKGGELGSSIPICLTIVDTRLFVEEKLKAQWPGARKDCRALLDSLIGVIDYPIFKVRMR